MNPPKAALRSAAWWTATGEYVGPLGHAWLADRQLFVDHGVLVVSASVADQMVFTTQLGRAGDIQVATLAALGLTDETTVADLMGDVAPGAEQSPLSLAV
jgi:hypothetical protein